MYIRLEADVGMNGEMRKRRTNNRLVEEIFGVLKDGKVHNASEIKDRIGGNWLTISDWLELIYSIQRQPKVFKQEMRSQTVYTTRGRRE